MTPTIHSLPRSGADVLMLPPKSGSGGVGRVARTLACGLRARGINADLLATDCSRAVSRMIWTSGRGAVAASAPARFTAALSAVLRSETGKPAPDALAYGVDAGIASHLAAFAAVAAVCQGARPYPQTAHAAA